MVDPRFMSVEIFARFANEGPEDAVLYAQRYVPRSCMPILGVGHQCIFIFIASQYPWFLDSCYGRDIHHMPCNLTLEHLGHVAEPWRPGRARRARSTYWCHWARFAERRPGGLGKWLEGCFVTYHLNLPIWSSGISGISYFCTYYCRY
jgi:hypothetical protein